MHEHIPHDRQRHVQAFGAREHLKDVDRHITPRDEREQVVEHMLDVMQHCGGTYYENVSELYTQIKEPLYLRREDPTKVLGLLTNKEDIPLSFYETFGGEETDHPSSAYCNATYWDGTNAKALRNPFIEGFANLEGVVTVVGFSRNAPVAQQDVKGDEMDVYSSSSIARENDISIIGRIRRDDVRFVVVRVPTMYIHDDMLTEQERDLLEEKKVPYVFRGVLFTDHDKDTAYKKTHLAE